MEIGLQMEENLYMALMIIIQAFTIKQKALTGLRLGAGAFFTATGGRRRG